MTPDPARDVLVVIPTLGRRLDYLAETLTSLTSQDPRPHITIVCPPQTPGVAALAQEFGAQTLADPGSLPGAINLGAASAQEQIRFVTWIGDDDLLTRDSIHSVRRALLARPDASLAYGRCEYIDPEGETIWTSRADRWAVPLMRFGPNLLPQPGSLIRRSAWAQVGGVDETYPMAFDLNLWLALAKIGPVVCLPQVVSQFRWHPDSLTVADRSQSLSETHAIQREHYPRLLRPLAPLWQAPSGWASRVAAAHLTGRTGSA